MVCVSDTHNNFPILPAGDVLIHAGDLTENGSFAEVQAGLTWLSSQPFQHKLFIAGNHDVLLDEDFLNQYPERRYGQEKTAADLDWGSVKYLRDSCVTLDVTLQGGGLRHESHKESTSRRMTVFGSPWTPKYGISAFQYPPEDADHWSSKFKVLRERPDIIVTHGPPKYHLDARDFYRAGCPYLGIEIAELRPKLHVFGHIHVGHGREDIVLDEVQKGYEEVMMGWSGYGTLAWMVILLGWGRLQRSLGLMTARETTTFVNAAVVGQYNRLMHDPIVVEL